MIPTEAGTEFIAQLFTYFVRRLGFEPLSLLTTGTFNLFVKDLNGLPPGRSLLQVPRIYIRSSSKLVVSQAFTSTRDEPYKLTAICCCLSIASSYFLGSTPIRLHLGAADAILRACAAYSRAANSGVQFH
jgi:hypothetical protein